MGTTATMGNDDTLRDRRKGGRPSLHPSQQKQMTLEVYLTADLAAAFKRTAYEEGMSASLVLRQLVCQYLQARNKLPPR